MRIYSATDVGQKRKMNQDYVFVSEGPVGNLPNLFTVADGMGGHNAGTMHPHMQYGSLWMKSVKMRITIR